MNLYTVQVTVTVSAESEQEAYGYIKTALKNCKQAEVLCKDIQVVATELDDDA